MRGSRPDLPELAAVPGPPIGSATGTMTDDSDVCDRRGDRILSGAPSTASAVLRGRASNAPVKRKDALGRTLKCVQDGEAGEE